MKEELYYDEDKVIEWMGKRDFFYREELADFLNWDIFNSDRQVRRVISRIAKKYPMISLSNGRGYKLITMEKYAESKKQIEAQIKENRSRAKEILLRNEPLYEMGRRLK